MMTISKEVSEDAMIEILSRVAVRTLMRFRCVCKYWNALVKNTDFISKHHKNYNTDDNTYLIVRYEDIIDGVRKYLMCLFIDKTLKDFSYKELNSQFPVYGCCLGLHNGIFCFIGDINRIFLWNMASKEYRILPKCRHALPPYMSVEYIKLGFGLDPIHNDYKLVLIRAMWDEPGVYLYEFSHVAVYNLTTDSWTSIKGNDLIKYHMDRLNDSTCIDGNCYWLTDSLTNQQVILSFSLVDDSFQEIEKPPMNDPTTIILGLYNNYLSMLVLNDTDNLFDIWVMRENCWTKLFTVGPILAVFWPLGFWKEDSFFVETRNEQLLLYDPSSEELKDVKLRAFGFKVYRYADSLTPIKRNDSFDSSDIPWHVLGIDPVNVYD